MTLGKRPDLLRVLVTLLLVAYPFAVYFGLQMLPLRALAALLILLLLLRLVSLRALGTLRGLQWPLAAGAALCTLALLTDDALALKLYPALTNAVLLGWFAMSLWQGPPVIERFARLQEPALDAFARRYTRAVTKVWCGFFALNGALALHSALAASDEWWMLYNGLLSYLAMALLFGLEYLLRRHLQRRQAA
jgi:uncharacterized membrane protein